MWPDTESPHTVRLASPYRITRGVAWSVVAIGNCRLLHCAGSAHARSARTDSYDHVAITACPSSSRSELDGALPVSRRPPRSPSYYTNGPTNGRSAIRPAGLWTGCAGSPPAAGAREIVSERRTIDARVPGPS